jgi:hypothetical protein
MKFTDQHNTDGETWSVYKYTTSSKQCHVCGEPTEWYDDVGVDCPVCSDECLAAWNKEAMIACTGHPGTCNTCHKTTPVDASGICYECFSHPQKPCGDL